MLRMNSDRAKANLLYLLIGLSVVAAILISKYDKPLATDKVVTGFVKSIVPSQSKYTRGLTAYIQIEDGPVITKPGGQLKVGERIKLRLYKSSITGREKYEWIDG